MFAEDDLLAKTRFEFAQDNSSPTNHDLYHKPPLLKHRSMIFRKQLDMDKYPEDYNLH